MEHYRDRPWLPLYRAGTTGDLTVTFPHVLALWQASVREASDRPLIHYFGRTCTLLEVDVASDALASALAERGIAAGDRLAVYLQNVPEFVITLLAAWKLGAIAVPVNPMLKERELRHVLTDSGATALVCLQELWNSVAAKAREDSAVTVAMTVNPREDLDNEVPAPLSAAQQVQTPGAEDLHSVIRAHTGKRPAPVALSPGDVALLTYTSGTTGDPKGAMNTHGNVVFTAHVFRDWIGLTADDVCLAAAPLFHITGIIGHIAVALLTRMPLVLGYRFDPATMSELAERHRATFTVMAITAYVALMDEPSTRGRNLSSLSKTYSCGAPIAPNIVERYQREMGSYIHNTYGLTETTAPSHAVPFGTRAPVDPATGCLSIGVPVFGTTARIVADEGHDMPAGELGEIVISGPGVVPGYWHQPGATTAALPAAEMQTGDIGFMDQHGWFYLVDRKKDMIIASGYKVWPREVEDVLLQHPAVREAAVVGVPDRYRGERVKAFVSIRPGFSVSEADLARFCRENMAAYKYPRAVEILPELPKTATGKVLRRQLRAGHH